jgi:hypothetical protein
MTVDTGPFEVAARARIGWLALAAALAAAGCGGGSGTAPEQGPVIVQFAADRDVAQVGDRARLAVGYRGGSGRVEPGVGPVDDGASVDTLPLDRDTTFRLVVQDASGRSVSRALSIPVRFRDRHLALDTPFVVSEHAAVTAGDGAVLVLGGSRGLSTLSDSIDRFDPVTRQFTRIGSLRTGRSGHTATRLPDGRVLVLGGASSLSIGNVADLVDERTGAVSHGGDLVQPRAWHAATLLADGRVLVTGGLGRDTAEIWDPATNTWRLLPARLAHVRQHHGATLLADGRVLITGGQHGGGAAYRFAELFDPRTERFEPVAATADERRLHAAHRLADGRVLIAGGDVATAGGGFETTASVLRFDPASGRLEAVAPLSHARSLVRSVLLPDDRLLLFGGDVRIAQPTATGEAYDAVRGGAGLAPMEAARAWHTVNRLADGRLLIVGGTAADGSYVPRVLLYE